MFSAITDWATTFQLVCIAFLNGQSLEGLGFYNPPYVIAPLIPFAVWGDTGGLLFFVAALCAFVLIALRLNPAWWSVLIVCLSPFTLMSIKYANIEWLVLLGLIMPRSIGIIFLLIKPQMTFIIIGYWVYQAWRAKRLLKLIAPSIALFAMSFVMDANWLTRMLSYSRNPNNDIANFSLFPYGIIIAFALGIGAIIQRRDTLLIGASPFAMPFVTATAWTALAFSTVRNLRLSIISLIAQWLIVLRIFG